MFQFNSLLVDARTNGGSRYLGAAAAASGVALDGLFVGLGNHLGEFHAFHGVLARNGCENIVQFPGAAIVLGLLLGLQYGVDSSSDNGVAVVAVFAIHVSLQTTQILFVFHLGPQIQFDLGNGGILNGAEQL